jgi:hypothetical protein
VKTDIELKQLLALMLPKDVFFTADGIDFDWSNASESCPKERRGFCILDTELLYLCSLVEAGLTEDERREYIRYLTKSIHPDGCEQWLSCYVYPMVSATWRQRVAALASVEGATL